MVRLDEYDKIEWWDVCRKLKPDLDWEEFSDMWEDFQERKAQGALENRKTS